MKKLTTFICIMLSSFSASWGQNSKIIAQSESSITFVVDENLPKIPHNNFTFKGDRIAQFILNKEEISRKPKSIIANSFANDDLLNMREDAFFDCVVDAYASHSSLVLSPDMVWLLINQGFARYVNAHSEELRSQLVKHTGEMDLIVKTDKDLLTEDADWEKLISDFSKQIETHTQGNIAKTITADFSTTNPTERIASEITLMETMKSYFEYIVIRLACGIPTITLEGTPKDWQRVLKKTKQLKKYGLDEWVEELTPILSEFVKAAKGRPNQKFWQGMVKQERINQLEGGLCAPGIRTELDGWMLKLFPDENGKTLDKTPHTKSMPSERVHVDFKYQVIDSVNGNIIKEVPMVLTAGFVGAQIDTVTQKLTPKIGWIVYVPEDDNDMLKKWENDASNFGLSIRVKEVPELLSKMQHIQRLKITFTDKVVLPDWMDKITIDNFTISGKLTEQEKAEIRKRFPKVEFSEW